MEPTYLKVELWQLITFGFGFACTMIGAVWVLVKIIVGQFTGQLDRQFQSQKDTVEQIKSQINSQFAAQENTVAQITAQIDAKFEAQDRERELKSVVWEQRHASQDKQLQDILRDFHDLQKNLPREFVQREDWVRFGSIMDKKMDDIYNAIDDLKDRFISAIATMRGPNGN